MSADIAGAIAPGFGQLKSISSGAAVAPGTEVAITPDASDGLVGSDPSYVAAREAAAEALHALGMRVVEHARLTLKLQVDAPHFGISRPDEEWTAPVSSDSTAPPGPGRKTRVTNHVELAIGAQEDSGQPGLALSMVLFDERGSPLWTSSFQAAGRVDDPDAMIRRMTRASLSALGAHAERSYVLTCETEAESSDTGVCLP